MAIRTPAKRPVTRAKSSAAATIKARTATPPTRTIKRIDVAPETMERERVGRFKALRSSAKAFIDTRLPNGKRDILTVIGRGVIEDADLAPPILDNKDFNVAYVRAKHGCGATLHIHETNEVFIPLNGAMGDLLAESRRGAPRSRARSLRYDISADRCVTRLPLSWQRRRTDAGGCRRHGSGSRTLAQGNHRRSQETRLRAAQWRSRRTLVKRSYWCAARIIREGVNTNTNSAC